MRVMTWNINSVRLRAPLLADIIKHSDPDVVCLQETKTPDEHFPQEVLEKLGYPHIAFVGMKGYNGVAILSKFPLEDIRSFPRCLKEDCRHIAAKVMRDDKPAFDLHNLYVPAGGDKPDPVINDKFQHKLDFVDELSEFFPKHHANDEPMIVVGDLNIAPLENDVWSHKQMLKVVSHTPVEVDRLNDFYRSMGWTDAVRHFVPEEEKLYSWWSYRARDWEASDRGRRLDHIWVTDPLKEKLKGQQILKTARGWERPSDHAPVIIDMDM